MGSFLNVCIYRIPKGESIVYPPSHCGSCGENIKNYDLIPVISWILLRGKCRKCGRRISWRYPLVELFTAIMFLTIYITYGYTLLTLKYIIMATFLIVIGLIDYDTTDVYSCTTLPAIIIGLIFIGINFFNGQEYLTYIIGGAVGFAVIALIVIFTNGMGWGDAEITLIGGIILGWKITLIMLMLSFIIGAVAGTFLIATKRKTRKDYMPFGPSIVVSIFICMFWGQNILQWYLGTFF